MWGSVLRRIHGEDIRIGKAGPARVRIIPMGCLLCPSLLLHPTNNDHKTSDFLNVYQTSPYLWCTRNTDDPLRIIEYSKHAGTLLLLNT